ncbi:hypothetical protein IWQ47_003787 [Aquimarina sp. EL_43]|nr:hypothetical protein [Aquimarina sp. EL_35]MBG6152693.1 hypothetical protein [Aquimarina sp. EL_32]MBG6170700.1 hypothetical protein [Aquimarina sp. EL_43]
MLKNILNVNGVKKLKKQEQTTIIGGYRGPDICLLLNCAERLDGKCRCENGKCVFDRHYCK